MNRYCQRVTCLVLFHVFLVLVVGLAMAGCGDDGALGTETPAASPATGTTATGTVGAPESGDETAPQVDPLLTAPAFDVRRIRTEPDPDDTQERPCDVAFAEDVRDVDGPEASFYPAGTVSHRVVRCAAPSGGGWLELAFGDAAASDAASVGTRIAFRLTSVTRGRQGYPVVSFLRAVGDIPEAQGAQEGPDGQEAPQVAPGFDFGRLRTEAALAGRPQRCAVDFVSELVLLDERTRRRGGYPTDIQNRLSAKCLHSEGDSWIDLIFSSDDAARALNVAPGAEITVEIESIDRGFAGRPMARLAPEP